MNTTGCGRPTKKIKSDDPLPCGSKLYWGFGQVGATVLEVLLCPACIQRNADEDAALEAATTPGGN